MYCCCVHLCVWYNSWYNTCQVLCFRRNRDMSDFVMTYDCGLLINLQILILINPGTRSELLDHVKKLNFWVRPGFSQVSERFFKKANEKQTRARVVNRAQQLKIPFIFSTENGLFAVLLKTKVHKCCESSQSWLACFIYQSFFFFYCPWKK